MKFSTLLPLKLIPLKLIWVNIFLFLFTSASGFSQVIINELVSSNLESLADEDGESSDWIELYNSGSETIDLTGYGISDDPEDLFKWEMPEVKIEAGAYYLFFASDKDRNGYNAFWETVIRENDETKYLIPASSVNSSWIDPEYDDSSWETGSFGIGYGDGDDATETAPGIMSVFTRTVFSVSDVENVKRMMLHIDFDDGYVAYLNGQEISRQNINGETPLDYNAPSLNYTEPILAFGGELESIPLQDFSEFLKTGENVLAIQVHNNSTGSSDLTLIPFLSLAYETNPGNLKGVADETRLEESQVAYPHTNFKLSSTGETIFITDPEGNIVDEITVPELKGDEAYGRTTETSDDWAIFTTPTPLQANSGDFYQFRLSVPELSEAGGFYTSSVDINVANDPDANVYYTTDGTIPTESSAVFESPVSFNETTTLRLRTMGQGKLSSDVITETFFVNENHDLPVFSLVTEPDNFWSNESGIYVEGTNGIDGNCTGPRNWNQDWEIPVHLEFYNDTGARAFGENVGVRIFGGCSRTQPQKSLSIFFRGEYGIPELEYPIFKEKDIDKFESFVLRNSGNDFNNTQLRDALMKTLIEDTKLTYQAYQPAVLYINGEYWGIQNIREKINEHFIASNYNLEIEDFDIIENNGDVKHGDNQGYLDLMSAFDNANMELQSDYEGVANLVDMDNYIDYMVAQTFFANTDWPGNNLRYWREKKKGGEWKWIIYDTDFGFSMYDPNYQENMFNFATTENGPNWPNPPWSTYMFRKFLENESFRHAFVNRYADMLNSSFNSTHIKTVIDSLSGAIESEMEAHKSRWGGSVWNWENNIETLREFADRRGEVVESHITSFFGVGNRSLIRVNVSNSEQGIVRMNRLEPEAYPANAAYFQDVPLELEAIPKPGYKFAGWTGDITSSDRSILVQPNETPSVTANFEASSAANTDIVINEIMYNAEEGNDPEDWIELYNKSGSEINVGQWIVKDEDDDHEFQIPNNTIIDGGGYLVIAQNKSDFKDVYSNLSLGDALIGNMDFGLGGGGDQVRIFDSSGNLVDEVEYDDVAPWPEAADGTGSTLELEDADTDNSLAESWIASSNNGGTPGSENGVAVSIEPGTDELPKSVSLLQNYPNPFNPTTTISFELTNKANVRLSVFDVLGREVAILSEGVMPAGTHSQKWDASTFSSGVYVYSLKVNGYTYTKKMLLTK